MNDLIALYKTLGFDDEKTVIKIQKEIGFGNDNTAIKENKEQSGSNQGNLIAMYKELGLGDENDLIAKNLGDKIAGLIHQNLHASISYKNAKLEIEKIKDSTIVASLSEKAKTHVTNMCDKASGIVELHNKEKNKNSCTF